MPPLLLASASPRRRALLEAVGFAVQVQPADVDETRRPGEHPVHLALRLAQAKAGAVAALAGDGVPVLAADTVVHTRRPGAGFAGAEIYEKPEDEADAARILAALADRWHVVTTGFCLLWRGERLLERASTRVRFRALTPDEIAHYIATGEPLDKAGAYGIQGQGATLVARVEGSYTNVVGLPLEAVLTALDRLGAPRPGR
ncbi:MAG: Maf family protein [Pseudomonadota bacterium]